MTIRGVLFPVAYGGQTQLDGIIAASLAGIPMMLVSGDEIEGTINGIYTVQSVDEDMSDHAPFGTPQRNAYTITLKRYDQGASAVPSLLAPILSLFD